jgi:chemotaxis protein CheC
LPSEWGVKRDMKGKNEPSKLLLEKKELKIFVEISNIGAKYAAKPLSKILKQSVTINVPRVGMIPPSMLPRFYHGQNAPTTAVCMHLTEVRECHFLFIFEMYESKEITTLMTKILAHAEQASIKVSVLEEFGNILLGSLLTAISDLTAVNIISASLVLIDALLDAIISDFVRKLSVSTGGALVIDTCSRRRGGYYAAVQLIIFLNLELQELLISKSIFLPKKARKGDVELTSLGNLSIETEDSVKAALNTKE